MSTRPVALRKPPAHKPLAKTSGSKVPAARESEVRPSEPDLNSVQRDAEREKEKEKKTQYLEKALQAMNRELQLDMFERQEIIGRLRRNGFRIRPEDVPSVEDARIANSIARRMA